MIRNNNHQCLPVKGGPRKPVALAVIEHPCRLSTPLTNEKSRLDLAENDRFNPNKGSEAVDQNRLIPAFVMQFSGLLG
jgi:hypothetical protein